MGGKGLERMPGTDYGRKGFGIGRVKYHQDMEC